MILTRILLFLFIISLSSNAETIKGKVISVIDGDTIKVSVKRKSYKIRLQNIDAPEKKQAFGEQSKRALSRKIFRKKVKIKITKTDRYNRKIGTVFYKNRNINLEMVQDGYAWNYQKYSNDIRFITAEKQARANRKRIWSRKKAIPPWEFRRKKRKK